MVKDMLMSFPSSWSKQTVRTCPLYHMHIKVVKPVWQLCLPRHDYGLPGSHASWFHHSPVNLHPVSPSLVYALLDTHIITCFWRKNILSESHSWANNVCQYFAQVYQYFFRRWYLKNIFMYILFTSMEIWYILID